MLGRGTALRRFARASQAGAQAEQIVEWDAQQITPAA
jgi:hypothetical protein